MKNHIIKLHFFLFLLQLIIIVKLYSHEQIPLNQNISRFGINLVYHGMKLYIKEHGGTPQEYINRQNSIINEIGIGWIRSAGKGDSTSLGWKIIEPQEDLFYFDLHDARVLDIQAQNLNELGCIDLSSVPTYAQIEGTYFDDNKYLKYLNTIVERYDCDGIDDMPGLLQPIKYWEIGNEVVQKHMFNGTAKEYAHVLRISSENIKANCPDCSVLIGGWVTGKRDTRKWEASLSYLDTVLSEGGGNFFDIMNYHEYTDDCDFLTYFHVNGFKELLAKYGLNKPIWITESNTKLEKKGQIHTIKRQAQDIVKRIVIAFDAGVDIFMWHMLEDNKGGPGAGLINENGVPKPNYYNYKLLIEKIEDFSSVQRICFDDTTIYVYQFNVHDNPLFIAWTENDTTFIDLSSCITGASVNIIQAVTESCKTEPDSEIVASSSICINETPIFILEKAKDTRIPQIVLIPGGEFEMGDHHNLGGAEHINDEVPVHTVRIDSFFMGITEVTNQQYCDYLNSALSKNLIEVKNGFVYAVGRDDIYCETDKSAPYSEIGWNGSTFTALNNKNNHPMVGVLWCGAAAYCNWLSSQNEYKSCYNLSYCNCDFSRNGFRLPTEAEWEYAGRGGQYEPYHIYPWGDDPDNTKANWPNSGDPYETGPYPWTTPAGFYNGKLHHKADFEWPGNLESYQTSDGSNGYGLHDMAGNVWEWCNDWYNRDYYSSSPRDNPRGPVSGTPMSDGKPYRVLRGGNWYNGKRGDPPNFVHDGLSWVSNRNPSCYRGPDDPNHAWYNVGFRIARNFEPSLTGIDDNLKNIPTKFRLFQNYPNPFNPTTTIEFHVPIKSKVTIKIHDILGREIRTLVNKNFKPGFHSMVWDGLDNLGSEAAPGMYLYTMKTGYFVKTMKALLLK